MATNRAFLEFMVDNQELPHNEFLALLEKCIADETPINHDADSLSEACGIPEEVVTQPLDCFQVSRASESVEVLENRYSKRELATLTLVNYRTTLALKAALVEITLKQLLG